VTHGARRASALLAHPLQRQVMLELMCKEAQGQCIERVFIPLIGGDEVLEVVQQTGVHGIPFGLSTRSEKVGLPRRAGGSSYVGMIRFKFTGSVIHLSTHLFRSGTPRSVDGL
jgi:hypothetical protein